MSLFYLIHYTLIKGLYRKARYKKQISTAVDSISVACLIVLILSIAVLIDNDFLWDLKRFRDSKTIIISAIIATFVLFMIVFTSFPKRQTIKWMRIKRKMITLTHDLRQIYSVLYLLFYLILIILTLTITIENWTPR
jgi:TRAP-type C4-dicarboxylate transport system permease large subunit